MATTVISWVGNKFSTQFLYFQASVSPLGEICSPSDHLMDCLSKCLRRFNTAESSRSRQKCRGVGSFLCPFDTSNPVPFLEVMILLYFMWWARWLWAVQATQSCHKSTSQHLAKAVTVAPHRKCPVLLNIIIVIRSTRYGPTPHCVPVKHKSTDVCEEMEMLFQCITQLRLQDNTKISIGFGFVLS